jgi:hypothetical protein
MKKLFFHHIASFTGWQGLKACQKLGITPENKVVLSILLLEEETALVVFDMTTKTFDIML